MGIELGVLDHLGLNLYSNMPAVLSEAVANAWDADATHVTIEVDREKQTITIRDDGCGMDLEDVNERFLKVGYRRREEGRTKTPSGRHVMGRKGIGKLSLFSIADEIDVRTVKTGVEGAKAEPEALLLDANEIRKRIKAKEEYHPSPLDRTEVKLKRGTELHLKALKKHATATTEKALRTRLARRFSIIGAANSFQVKVDGEAIGPEDRDYFTKVEYLWSVGSVGDRYEKLAKAAKRTKRLKGVVDAKRKWKVEGWIGTFDERKSIEPDQNALTILAWGKLVQENLLAQLPEGGLFTKYLIGELRADFLDVDDKDDITTSDRQRLKETDPRYEALVEFVKSEILTPIGSKWRDWRREDGMKAALEEPAVEEWFESLKPAAKKYATTLFGRIGQMAKEDSATRRTLYKHGILAFERLRFKEALASVEKVQEEDDLELLSEFVAGFDDLEAAYYYEIVQGRLEVVHQFEKVVDTEKERVIQQHVFDHLWLLHPSWERASTNKRIEESVTKEFAKVTAKLSAEEKKGRIDIRYRTAAGTNIIVELKKYDRSVTLGQLQDQVQKYRNALSKVLKKFPDEPQSIQVVVILGKPVTNASPDVVARSLNAIDTRVVYYDQLIQQTQESYSDYLEASAQLSKLATILDKLDPDDDPG
jgi:Histidine kinase-, DNA gyrase B-, and HSP90-like ATPase